MIKILLLIASISAASTVEWSGFLGKFTKCLLALDGLYDMPYTVKQAVSFRTPYSDTGVRDEFGLKVYCLKNDPHVCPLFDKNDNVAGLRISHTKKEVANDLKTFPYKYDEIPLFNSATFLGHELWYTTFLFTKPENLLNNGPGKISKSEPADGLWVKLSNGYVEIPRDECEAQKAGWKKQGFIPWMGNHYSIGQTDDCSTFNPLLALFHQGRLIGMAFTPFGKATKFNRDWFEKVPSSVIKKIVPDGYEPCLQKWTAKYEVRSFHFYFVKHPRFILWDQSAKC